ncbi:big1-domain-containing protein [Diplodia corticola]|uniref:Protein BIG1 n=1 Tax=Diplodia corticola TaxID=236234 RepID=A0A1J9QVB5_9PEZI|nr:big1-domain-containing protein [Diplodia corticola]OJD32368.1 big1-domain-containing protein [Diplodia corticola]
MALRTVGAIALSISAAAAFQGTSPLFVVSSADALPEFADKNIISSAAAARSVEQLLAGCPSESYVVVNQPGVSPTDFEDKWSAPWLRSKFHNADAATTTASINEVVGGTSADHVIKYLEDQCKATRMNIDASNGYISLGDASPRVIKLDFTAPPSAAPERASELTENDSFLDALMSSVQEKSYTLIYTTTPPAVDHVPAPKQQHPVQGYEMEETFPLHTEMKRALADRAVDDDDVALFEKYQFLSPGIFMGLSVSILLFLILYVGVTAVAGLEVSYFAFSKEMGPAAQKKQQ